LIVIISLKSLDAEAVAPGEFPSAATVSEIDAALRMILSLIRLDEVSINYLPASEDDGMQRKQFLVRQCRCVPFTGWNWI
jgi:hypothetical protein